MKPKLKATPSRDRAVVYINGIRHEIAGRHAFMMLSDYLRYECALVGTKIVCAEGDCGACSVLRASALLPGQKQFEAINSCIVTMAQLDGTQLVTIEGLQTKGKDSLNPVQEAVVACHGSQCGYCTPGFVVTLTALCHKAQDPLDEQKVKNALTGNLCRCTGYSPLIKAALNVDLAAMPSLDEKFQKQKINKILQEVVKTPLHLSHESVEFFAPTTLAAAVALRKAHPSLRLISSATDLGVQMNKGKWQADKFLSLHLIPELYKVKKVGKRLHFGARVNLSEVRETCKSSLPEFADFLDIFASPQIKNVATLIGNIANASPIGDTIPFLMVSDTMIEIMGPKKNRELPLTDFYKGYRLIDLKPDEVITGLNFRIPGPQEILKIYKVSQRKDLDISTVNSAYLFRFDTSKGTVKEARIAVGGIGPTVKRCTAVEEFLQGKTMNDSTIDQALTLLQESITPLSDVRGTEAYRRTLVDGLFRKYCESLPLLEVP